MLPGLSQNSRRKNSQLLNLSTERTTKGHRQMKDEIINLDELSEESRILVEIILNATPEEFEELKRLAGK